MRAPFEKAGPDDPQWPVIFSVPHAGRDYPPELSDDCRYPADRLLPLEDRLADLLVGDLIQGGFSGIVAHVPRAVIDLNRAERDMDPGMLTAPMALPPVLSAKARGGLGLVPRRTAALGDIWRRRFSPREIEDRINQHHRPYHANISQLMDAGHRQHGAAILLDIHSMPPLPADASGTAPQIIIGDRFGRTAGTMLSEIAGSVFEADGLRVAFNAPYAGGHILERHAAPSSRRHAIQLEIDRRLYLDADLRSAADGVQRLSGLIRQVAEHLSAAVQAQSLPIAAE